MCLEVDIERLAQNSTGVGTHKNPSQEDRFDSLLGKKVFQDAHCTVGLAPPAKQDNQLTFN